MYKLLIVLLVIQIVLISVSSNNLVSIPLIKFVDESGARILQEAINSRSVPHNISKSHSLDFDSSKILQKKYSDDKYIQYFTRIEIGKPPQHFDVAFNPAVMLHLIPSYAYKKKCRGAGILAYDPQSSHSYENASETASFLEKKLVVEISRDTFTLGKIKINSQEFGLVKDKICEMDNVYDGVIGLGFSTNHHNLLDTMIVQKIVNKSIVALYLNRDVKTLLGGEVTFGGWNPRYLAQQPLDYIPIVESQVPAWQIHIKYAFIGDQQVTFDMFAIIDTNSHFIDLPWYEAEIIAQAIGAYNFSGNHIIPCIKINELPNLKLIINKQEYILHPADYIDQVNTYKGYCMVLIRSTNNDVWTLGGAFLGKFYTILNYETREIAFGKLVQQKSNGLSIHTNLWMSMFLILMVYMMPDINL